MHFGTKAARSTFVLTVTHAVMQFAGLRIHAWKEAAPRYLYRFVDRHGRVAIWWASAKMTRGHYHAPLSVAVGEELQVKATVKDHSNYEGVDQTVLTRVALVARTVPAKPPIVASSEQWDSMEDGSYVERDTAWESAEAACWEEYGDRGW